MNEVYSIVDSKNIDKLLQCPYCKEKVEFKLLKDMKDSCCDLSELTGDSCNRIYMGLRECSNPECGGIFSVQFRFIANPRNYNPVTNNIDYDEDIMELKTLPTSDYCSYLEHLPENIEKSFIEAQKCFYDECYTASAIMIRKTLEEFFENFKIEGKTLKIKIDKLYENYILPVWIDKTDFHTLRELGNDGAHIVLKDFNKVGKKEVETAIKVINNILIMTYESRQNYKDSINKLKALKKQ